MREDSSQHPLSMAQNDVVSVEIRFLLLRLLAEISLRITWAVPFQSGNYAKAHKRFACLKPLRNALYQFARATTRQEGWALDYYRRKRAEGKTHSMAVRALANVWVRIIYAMWVNKSCYQTETFETAQLAHAKRVA